MPTVMFLCAIFMHIPSPDFAVVRMNLHGIAEITMNDDSRLLAQVFMK